MIHLKGMAFFLLSALALASGLAAAAVEDDIRARLAPVGELCLIGDQCAAGLAMASTASGEPRDPEAIYQTFCFACHGTGANNSPVLGNVEMWAPRLEQGIDVLYQHAIEGFNNNLMPPKGLCMDCSEEEIRATVDYMVQAVQ